MALPEIIEQQLEHLTEQFQYLMGQNYSVSLLAVRQKDEKGHLLVSNGKIEELIKALTILDNKGEKV